MPPTNDRVRLSAVAISRVQEAMYNQGAALAVTLETDREASIPNPTWEVMNNSGRAGGKEFPDRITESHKASYGFPLKFDYLQPHEAEALFAYALGGRETPVDLGQGLWRKVYFSSEERERPSFATGFQLSDESPVNKLLIYGCKVNTLTLEGNRAERFPTINADIVASGKDKKAVYGEVVEGLHTATSLTLGRAIEGPLGADPDDAQDRLDSVHAVIADVDGDGTFEEKLTVTAASDATPSILTVVPPSREPYRTVYSDNGVLTDYSDEANSIAAGDVPGGLVLNQDYLYLGFRERITSFFVDVGAVANNVATSILTLEYWTGTAWAAVANLSDLTIAGGISLAQDGIVSFTLPTDWNRMYFGEEGKKSILYWLRLSATVASFRAETVLTQIYASNHLTFDKVFKFTSPATYADETADAADLFTGTVSIGLAADGFLYLGSLRPFAGAQFDIETVNAEVQTNDVEYWDGAAWTGVTGLTDNTVSGGATFAQDGTVVWTRPTDWVKTTVGSETTKRFWVRFVPTGLLTAGATANSIRLLSKWVRYQTLYRARESLYLPEMATMPATIGDESSLAIHMARVLIGGKFDGVNLDRGYTLGCSLNTFTLTFNNNHQDPTSCFQGESDGAYGDELLRGDPEATIAVNRKLIDWLVQHGIAEKQYFSIHLEFTGAEIPDTNPVIRPRLVVHMDRCWYEEAAIAQADGRYTEDITIRVGESDDHPAVVVVVENTDSTGFAVAA